ncbi:MAG: hypothetical protein KDA42_12570 [Planctomycetales bacterium]|nr:hypothetical protein [Planctomycetales bacterium]
MNYFAHGRHFVEDPFFLAGVSLPDWLSVLDRRIRARARRARPLVESEDRRLAAFAAGVCRHHEDDAWFHGTRAFAELSLEFTLAARDVLPADEGFRPSFLGHILVELLLDAALIEDEPTTAARYYDAIDELDCELVETLAGQITGSPAAGLAPWIRRFSAARFLLDYQEDAKLCYRLNQVMQRVRLLPLPASFQTILPPARQRVRERMHELLTPWETIG